MKFEKAVENFLQSSGYSKRKNKCDRSREDRFYIKEFLYTNVLGKEKSRLDFYIFNRGEEISLECKSQRTSGSVDDKFPLLYLNAKNCQPGLPVIFIHGGGACKSSVAWLKEKCSSCERKKILVIEVEGDNLDPLGELLS